MAYIKKGSVPSLLSGGSISIVYFVGGALASKGKRSGLTVSLAASLILLVAGLVRCVITKFEKNVPLGLAALGLVSTIYYSYLLL